MFHFRSLASLCLFTMKKRTLTVAFKHEVLTFMEAGNSGHRAAQHFSARDHCAYDEAMFRQWWRAKDAIQATGASRLRVKGGGRKSTLGSLEEVLADEIIELRICKVKVTRGFIAARARAMAEEHKLQLMACGRWVSNFMARHGFSLRRATNLSTLTDDELLQQPQADDIEELDEDEEAHLLEMLEGFE